MGQGDVTPKDNIYTHLPIFFQMCIPHLQQQFSLELLVEYNTNFV